MPRWALVPVSLAVIAITTLVALSAQTPELNIEVTGLSGAVRARADAAARIAVADYTEWLGPPPFDRLSIGDGSVRVQVPIWDSAAALSIESQVAEGIAHAWLGNISGNDQWKNGLAIYLQSRIVEKLFNLAFLTSAYRYDSSCWFGCHVRWPYRSLPLDRRQSLQDPIAGAFASLERELGWPTLQGALRAAATSGGSDPVAAMSAATGRDLSPVFLAAAGGPIDYAIAGVATSEARCAGPCFHTQVSLTAGGPVPFPLLLRVTFADGRAIETGWQGRERVEFESAAPAVAVALDPDRVWVLDRNPFDNARVEPRETNVPIAKWVARWITWLQDAMLTRTFPV